MKRSPVRGGAVRIIGGRWRGTRLPIVDVEGLRPTPDRLRETLFNWLTPVLPGARCLDLFAGSGALGLEAASRGAAEVTLVERDLRCVRLLRETLERLRSDQVCLHQADASRWLAGNSQVFDVVFLDPPYASDLLDRSFELLIAGRHLRPGALVYQEQSAKRDPQQPPEGWLVHRESRSGRALGRLWRCASEH